MGRAVTASGLIELVAVASPAIAQSETNRATDQRAQAGNDDIEKMRSGGGVRLPEFRSARLASSALGMILTSAMLASSPAAAQETRSGENPDAMSSGAAADRRTAENGAEATTVGDIIVTARKVAENLQDVPIAVTQFSGDQLLQQNATRASDIGRLTPSLSMKESSSNPTGLAITLRGQVQTSILASLDPSVGTYVDGYYWARAYGLNGDLLDIQSVQVLKGPQGTLFGRNTTGGAILFQTNDPSFSGYSGLLSATYGRFDEMNGTAILNAPLVQDRFAVRLAVSRSKRDGTVRDFNTGARYEDRDNLTARGKLLFRATENLSLLLSAERFETKVASPKRHLIYVTPTGIAAATAGGLAVANAYIARVENDPSIVAVNVAPLTDVTTQTYTGTLTLDTFFGAVKFIGGTRKIDSVSAFDLDGSPFEVQSTTGYQRLSQYSGELQITGKAFSDAIDFAAGALYFHESGVDGQTSITTPATNPRTSIGEGRIDNDSLGVYGQATWHVTDKFSVTGGLRYSVEDKGLEIRGRAINRITGVVTCSLAPATVLPLCALARRDDFSGVSYMASVDYKIDDDILVYAKSSKGFRSGGQNLRAPRADAFIPFKPEISHEHEVGLKSELFDRRVRLNLAAYYNNITDIQRTTLTATPGGVAGILGNAGKVRILGLEAELLVVPVEGLQLGATGALTRPKYLVYRDLSGDRRRERFENVPRHSFSLSAAYTSDVGFGKLLLRTDYSWQDKISLNAFNNPANANNAAIIAATTAPASGVVNARASISFNDSGFELAVFGRNLANNRDRVTALLVPEPIGFVQGTFREPRTYGVTGTFRFGGR